MATSMRFVMIAVRTLTALLVLVWPAGAGVALLQDLAYGPDPAQRLDIYRRVDARTAPVVVMVHGGAWAFGDKTSRGVAGAKADHFLARGYVFISVNYRLVPVADPVEQARDVGRAIAYVQSNARQWGADADGIVLMGHSAGAHLVALLTADSGLLRETGAKPWRATVALDTAAYDLPAIMEGEHPRLYDRAFGDDPAYWRRASPIHNLAGRPAPMLLVCSTLRAESCPPSARFAQAVTATGGRADLVRVPLGHMAIDSQLGRPGDFTAAVEDFLRSLELP